MINRRNFVGLGAGAALGSLDLFAEATVGKPAPELVIALNSGEQLLLSKYRGKVVVLEFLLTTCSHCQRCSAIMEKVHSEMGGAFQPLGAAVNPEDMMQARAMIPQYIYNLHLNFPVGWTKREMAYDWMGADQSKGNVYFPQVAIIDKKGIVRAFHPGTDEAFFKDEENNIKQIVGSQLKEGPGAAVRGSR